MAKLFIGMPVFNSDGYIEAALDSLIQQDYSDWQLLISDNHSSDHTPDLARHYSRLDSRIRYVRQDRNLGAPANFKFLMNTAEGDYFMWAAGDDVWAPGFISSGVAALEADDRVGLAFGNVVNTDTYGDIIRTYPGFAAFSGSSRWKNVLRYQLSPEIMGKANLIYGVMPLNLTRAAYSASPLTDNWGSDMAFVLAVISRSRFAYIESMMLKKRIVRDGDVRGKPRPIVISRPKDHCFEIAVAPTYIADALRAVRGTPFLLLTVIIMSWRLISVCTRNLISRAGLYRRLFFARIRPRR